MSHQTKVLLALLVGAALLAAIAFAVISKRRGAAPPASQTIENAIQSATDAGAVTAPSANPYQDVPSLNPVEQVNPFRNLKTNPFAQ